MKGNLKVGHLKEARRLQLFTERVHFLDDVAKWRLPTTASARWSPNSRLLQTISSQYQSDVRAVFGVMSENPDSWDSNSLLIDCMSDMIDGCQKRQHAWGNIFSVTDALFRVLQNNIGYCCARIDNTIRDVEGSWTHQTGVWLIQWEIWVKSAPHLAWRKVEVNSMGRDERKQTYYSIMDNRAVHFIRVQMKARFDHFGELGFLGLLNCKKCFTIWWHH